MTLDKILAIGNRKKYDSVFDIHNVFRSRLIGLFLRNVKRIHKSTESDYLYVLQKANIISANIESQNIKLSGVSIYEHISNNEKLKLLDQESIELRNINGRENLTFTISRLDLLTDVVNELSLFCNKNPYDIKIEKSINGSFQISINF